MAAEVDPVVLEIRADLNRYKAELRSSTTTVDKELGRQEKRVRRLESEMKRSSSAIGGYFKGLIGAIGGLAVAREYLRIADSAKQIEAQLRLATRETGNFAQAQKDVRRIAAETRTGLEESATLYATFQRNALELGISQEQAARATETVTKAFQISGASAEEAAGGLRQFLQGLQSGALRGEELNSVLENAPRLAKLLADSLGVTVGQLRAMGAEGDLAADKLIAALTDRKFTEGIDAEFRELPVTFEQAMQQVENAATITFSAFDRGGGFSQMLANFISDGAAGFDDLEQSALDTGIEIRSTFEGLANAFDPLLEAAKAVFGEIEGDAKTLGDRIRPLLVDLDTIMNFSPGGIDQWIDRNVWGIEGPSNLTGRFDEARSRSAAERRGAVINGEIEPFLAKYDTLGNLITPARPRSTGGGGSGARRAGGGGRGSAASAARRAEQERLAAIREDASKQRELTSLNDDLLAARAALATAADDILRFNLEQIESEKNQKIAQLQTEVDLGKLTADEFAQRKEILDQIAAAKVQRERIASDDAQTAQLARQESNARRDQIYTLEAEADLINAREDRLRAEQRILDLVYAEEEALIRAAAANGDIADLDEALANLKRRQLADQERIARDNESPLQRYARGLNESDLGDEAEQLIVDEIETVRGGIRDAIADAIGTDDPLITGLLDLLLQDLIFKPLANSLANASGGGGGGFFGSLLSGIGSIFGGTRASGGYVSPGSMYRVNEGSSPGRVEGFRPAGSGEIIPLGQMNALANGGMRSAAAGGVTTVRLELSGDIDARIDQRSAAIAVQVVRVSEPGLTQKAVNETFKQAARPRM